METLVFRCLDDGWLTTSMATMRDSHYSIQFHPFTRRERISAHQIKGHHRICKKLYAKAVNVLVGDRYKYVDFYKLVITQPILTLIYLLCFLPPRMAAGRVVGTWAMEGKENPRFPYLLGTCQTLIISSWF
jgi:hypothetical protein